MVAAVQVVGARELRRAFKQASDDAKDELKETHLEAAQLVADEAKVTVPTASGVLAGTIRAAGQQAAGVVRAGYARVPYAGPIHFGWRAHNIEPQPYLYEAADRRADEVIDAYYKRVDDILDQIRRSTL